MDKKKPQLQEREKKVLAEKLNSPYVKKLSEWDQNRLKRILPCLFWAEKQLKEQGKKFTLYIEKLLSLLKLDTYIFRTVGPWNFNKIHAQRFAYTPKEFVRKLKNFDASTEIVIRHICEDIGLHKDPDLIFAEYNAGIFCTKIAGLQSFLNPFFLKEGKEPLFEDGIWGEETQKAVKKYLPDVFTPLIQDKTFPQQLETLFAKDLKRHGIQIILKVPQLRKKTPWKMIFKPPLPNQTRLKILLDFLRRDVDIPAYVERGMKAYLGEDLLR